MLTLPSQHKQSSILSALGHWWQGHFKNQSKLFELSNVEIENVARDLGLSASDLRALVSHGAGGANLLHRRMASLHLTPDELTRTEPALVTELERLCTLCRSRGQCADDLARNSADSACETWREYCPNVETLSILTSNRQIE